MKKMYNRVSKEHPAYKMTSWSFSASALREINKAEKEQLKLRIKHSQKQ